MDFITPIVTPIFESMTVRVTRQFGFFFSSSKYVRDMHTKVRELIRTARDMDNKQKANNADSLVVPHNVPEWLEEVDKIKIRADSVSTGIGCCNVKLRYKAGKESYDILKVIDRLMKEKSEIVWTDRKISLAMVSSPRPSTVYHDNQNKNNIESRDLIFNEAFKSLEPNNNKTQKMALCGMAGVGKTTMMEQLKKAAIDRKMFDWVVKVNVGQNLNPMIIQQTVAEYLGEALTETTKDTRAERLKKRFEKMSEEGRKKILVILDDVWEVFNLKDIGLTSPFPNGFKLLLISRDENVCTLMGVETSLIFKIVVLKDLEAKNLFWETVGLDNVIELDLHHIGEDIVKRCGGLPIAITIIASTLRDSIRDAWEDALFRLQNKEFRVLDNIFEISYNNLKEDFEKAIFLLSGLFPEDHNIVIEELLMYGWGLKIFKNVHTITKARSRVKACVYKLIRSNLLLQSDREGCVKMHDLVRDFVLSNFSKVKQASIANHDTNVTEQLEEESYDRILLKCGGMFQFPVAFNHQNLTLLKLMDGFKVLKFPKGFYTRMEKIEVLAYENMHRPLLPQYLTNLRALCLSSCSLMDDDISFLGDLINLEVLSLAHCGISKLPSKIGKLKRLKLFDLTGCLNLCIADHVFQNMEKLEELYMSVFQNDLGDGTTIKFTDTNCDELKMLSRKLSALELEFCENKAQPRYVSFDKLERFRISVGCLLEKKRFGSVHVDEYSFKNTLKLVTNITELVECKINILIGKTEILYLEVNDMNNLEDVLAHPPQYSFCNLKALHVCGSVRLTCLFTIPLAKGLRKLENLVIRSCPILKEIWSYEITSSEDEVHNFSMLRRIEVKDCNSLVNLFPHDSMRLLSHLEEIKVEECGSIEVLFNMEQGKFEQFSSSLRRIELRGLVKLREVWRIKTVKNYYYGFHAIESIFIAKCKRFRNIFTPTTVNFDMRALTNIHIWKCGEYVKRKNEINTTLKEEISKIDHIFVPSYLTHNCHQVRKIEFYGVQGVEILFEIDSPSNREPATTQQQPSTSLVPYLEDLHLTEMNTLSHVWKCNSWNELFIPSKQQPQSSFQSLTTIKLESCNNIKYLLSPLMVKFLPNLKQVKIISCDSMEEVVSRRDDDDEDEEKTSTSTYGHITNNFFPHLHILHLSNMSELKHIGGGIAKGTTNGQSKFSQVDIVSWSLCQYSREIRIYGCHALSSVIPSYAAGRVEELEMLSIERCRSIMDVFESKEINNNNKSGCSSSTIVAIPRPTNSTMHKLPNLKTLEISKCKQLEYIFSFSTLESLKKLETLTIRDCKEMKVIVREEFEDQTMASSKNMDVVFPRLKSIELVDLPNLAGFSLGMNIDFQWPFLDYVMINDCPQMMAFTFGRSTSPRLKYIHTKLGKHYLECGLDFHATPTLHQTSSPSLHGIDSHPTISEGRTWSFHNLIECNFNYYGDTKIIPSSELQQLQKLETIHAKRCSNVEVVFEVALELTNNVVKFPKLREVNLEYLSNLKYIWKSNKQRLLEFPNLTKLSIHFCSRLEHVFTCSMVGCVMQLQELRVRWCTYMKALVKEEDCDSHASEIKFPCLKSLELENLEGVEGFYLGKEDVTFPSLDTLVIKKCPRISVFSVGHSIAPKLEVVETSFGFFNVGEDINSFIITKKEKGFSFGDLECSFKRRTVRNRY